jgi:hypothetical protein
MLFTAPLPFVETFVEELDAGLREHDSQSGLSQRQRYWLSFCLMGLLMTNSLCWSRFERASLGGYKPSALSWMFHHGQLAWDLLFEVSVSLVLRRYGIEEGILSTDDSDHGRSKRTRRIFKAHKQKDKKSGGYINGQTLVVVVLVTQKVTLPIGVDFYQPDPVQQAWRKEEERLKKEGVAKNKRPRQPALNPAYPTKPQLALRLMERVKRYHPNLKIKAVVADALYGQQVFMDAASALFNNCQVISQIRGNQNIRYRNRKYHVEDYFSSYGGVAQAICLRGQSPVTAMVGSARLHVDAHGKKRFVIALKYPGEKDYRYLVATDMSWRTLDIIQAYSLRWLVEVFIEDWKSYEGWAQLAKQQGEKGAVRGVTLSLLLDHCLLLHPQQLAHIKHKHSAYTVGSLQRSIQMDALMASIKEILQQPNPLEQLNSVTQALKELFVLNPSKKHMIGKDLGRLEPTSSLKHRAAG